MSSPYRFDVGNCQRDDSRRGEGQSDGPEDAQAYAGRPLQQGRRVPAPPGRRADAEDYQRVCDQAQCLVARRPHRLAELSGIETDGPALLIIIFFEAIEMFDHRIKVLRVQRIVHIRDRLP